MAGFFSSSQLVKMKKLPPRMNVDFPPAEKKAGGKPSNLEPISSSTKPQAVLDTECYINLFLVKFKIVATKELLEFRLTPTGELNVKAIKKILKKYEIVTFNGIKYDIPMIRLALEGANTKELKQASDILIKDELAVWKFEEKYNLPKFNIDHIDLIELPKGIQSLKIYGGRLHCEKIQDLPYHENTKLTREEIEELSEYCGNDLDLTELLLINLFPQIELRRVMSEQYGIDLLSKSDAQIAEAVIKAEYETKDQKLERESFGKDEFLYEAPNFIKFKNSKLRKALEIVTTKPFVLDNAGRPKMPEELSKLTVTIGSTTYNMGMGGLHSQEKKAFHVADSKYTIHDWDVASYYPMIILNCGLYPKHLGPRFLKIFKKIVDERLEAKRSGNKTKADSLKITINGSFGKFGSPYSALYAPDLMVQVTVTGQLSLLMLIEEMEDMGISVISGNTDGIVLKCPVGEEDTMKKVIKRWERRTGFEMEETKYAGIYSRDINNYIAVKCDGSVKLKGCFAPPSLNDKNPENEICTIAMVEYLKYGTPFEDTIRGCKDITKFLTLRSVTGGAVKNGEYLGKAIRWYHAKNVKGCISYKKNGNMVPNTEGCLPFMDLKMPFPNDIDYDWYVVATSNLFGK